MEIYLRAEIVVEKLDFRNLNLSKRMNRLLSRFGKACIVAKLKSMEEEFGIVTKYENPAYTSQQCSVCGYVDMWIRATGSRSQFLSVNFVTVSYMRM